MRSTSLAFLLCFISAIAAAPQSEPNPPDPQKDPHGDHGKLSNGGHLHNGDAVPPDVEPQHPKICFCCLPSIPHPTAWCDLLTETGTCPNFNSAFTNKVCCTFNIEDGTSNCADLGPIANAAVADSTVNSILSGVGTAVDGLLKGL